MKAAKAVDPVVGAALHPIRTTAWALGLVRGVAASVIRVASGERGHLPDPGAGPVEESVEHAEMVPQDLIDAPAPHPAAVVEAAPERAPEPLRESFANEPKAVSRESAHGRGGADAEIDDWYGETDEDEDEGEGFVLEALAAGDNGSAVEPGELKAILSESETLRKAAELDKG